MVSEGDLESCTAKTTTTYIETNICYLKKLEYNQKHFLVRATVGIGLLPSQKISRGKNVPIPSRLTHQL